jgi:hypothetical protein
MADIAIVRGGRLYTLLPYRDPFGHRCVLRWVAYCGDERLGFFATKRDFELAVDRHAAEGLTPQQLASIEAEQRSTAEGLRLLDQCVRLNRLKGTRLHPSARGLFDQL